MNIVLWTLILLVFFGLSFRKPLFGVAGVIVGLPGYLLRTTVLGFPTTALEAAILGTLGGWLLRVVIEGASKREAIRERLGRLRASIPQSFTWLLLVAAAGWVLSTIVSIDVRPSMGALKAWFFEPLAIGLIILSERDDRGHSILERAALLSLLWVAIAGIIQMIALPGTVEDGRLSSVFAPVANYYAMFAVPLIVLSIGLAVINQLRGLALFAAAVGTVALFFSYSYGGYLGVLAGILMLLFTVVPSAWRKRILVGFGLLVIVVFLSQRSSPYLCEKINFTTRSSSLVRTQIWRTAIEIGREHPLLGIGPGTFEQAYRETVPRLYFPPLEWLVAKPHNLYLNLWVETGVLGFIGTLGFFAVFLLHAMRSSPFARLTGAAIIALLVHGLVDTPIFKNDLAILTVVIVVLGLRAMSRENSP